MNSHAVIRQPVVSGRNPRPAETLPRHAAPTSSGLLKRVGALTYAISGLILLFSSPGLAQTSGAASDAQRHPVLVKISRAASRVETIASKFRQEKRTVMLSEPMISTGRLLYQKPDRLRWEITHPTHFGFIINGNRALRWKGEHAPGEAFLLEERPVIRRFANQLFAWIQADFSRISALYRIQVRLAAPPTLALHPRSESEKNMIDRIVIRYSPDSRHVETVEIHEHDGDLTSIRFTGARINLPLKKEQF